MLDNLINKGNGMFVSPDILDQQLRQACLINATEILKIDDYAQVPSAEELIKVADQLYTYVKNGTNTKAESDAVAESNQ